eukprot:COSAG02_NODE_1863_length_10608_cov_128.518508_3_plen_105_part_00
MRVDAQPYLGMPGDEIISQGRLGDEMFLLSKGQVQILVKDPSLVVASDGQGPGTDREPLYASAMHGMVFCDGAFFGELPVLGTNTHAKLPQLELLCDSCCGVLV